MYKGFGEQTSLPLRNQYTLTYGHGISQCDSRIDAVSKTQGSNPERDVKPHSFELHKTIPVHIAMFGSKARLSLSPDMWQLVTFMFGLG